jgi:NAD(P)-dependent dehydrogenase (short-subunit alcohol dehydrogenase family)
VTSVWTIKARRGLPRRSDYGASKIGIHLLSQSLAEEVGPHGIRVNTVVPGLFMGDNLRGLFEYRAQLKNRSYESIQASYASRASLKRIPEPEEVAYPILFMACDWSSAITGQSLDVNAGMIFH